MKAKLFATFVIIAIILLINVSATKDYFRQQEIQNEKYKSSNNICQVGTLFNEVWVDDNYNASTPGWQEDHFKSIQDGVYAVSEGGTVRVYEGFYIETIVINKPLNLIGNGTKEDWNTTINGRGEPIVIYISQTNNVNISGFSIFNSRESYKNANILIQDSPYCNISHNEMPGGACAVRLKGWSNHTTISFNQILNCICDGIVLGSSYNNVCSNIIRSSNDTAFLSNQADGIQLERATQFNIINNNTIENNLYDGIWMDESDNNTISNNRIMSNGNSGIQLNDSSFNIIFNNTIENNGGLLLSNIWGYGVIIFDDLTYSEENKIYHNNFKENRGGLFNLEINAFDSNIKGANLWYNETAENRKESMRYTPAEKGGNYWSDYEEKCPGAEIEGMKGTWDKSYGIPTRCFGRSPMIQDPEPFTREYGWESPRNSPPLKPNRPDGNQKPTIGALNIYYFQGNDSDPKDNLSYLVDWGNGTTSGWDGPYSQENELSINRTFEELERYSIRFKVKDDFGLESEWSEPLRVTVIPDNKVINHLFQSFPDTFIEKFLTFIMPLS